MTEFEKSMGICAGLFIILFFFKVNADISAAKSQREIQKYLGIIAYAVNYNASDNKKFELPPCFVNPDKCDKLIFKKR